MTSETQTYLNKVRERDNETFGALKCLYEAIAPVKITGARDDAAVVYAMERAKVVLDNADVPKLVQMLEIAIEDIQSECYCVPDGRERLCERCSVLKDIEQIARGCNCRETINGPVVCLKCREVTGDAEMDRNVLV